MASLCKKTGASGKESPYWQAILSFSHSRKKVWVSTKQYDRRTAKAVSDRWTDACWYAARRELGKHRERLLNEIEVLTKCPATLDASRELFSRLVKETTGEEIHGENFNEFVTEWITARAAVTAA